MKSVFHIIIGLFFSLLVGVLVTQNNINLFMGDPNDFRKATIYFKQSTLDKEVDDFILKKLGNAGAEKISKISKEQALSEFKATFGDFSQNLSNLSEMTDLVPLSVEIIFDNEPTRKEFMANEGKNDLIDEIVAVDKVFSRYSSLQKSLGGFMFLLFGSSFLICALLTSLLIKNLVYKDQKKIEIYALFGQSYRSIVVNYFRNLFFYFLFTVVLSIGAAFVVFVLLKYKLNAAPDLHFIAERIRFLSISQILILVACFGLAYFGGLFFVLRNSVQKSFSR